MTSLAPWKASLKMECGVNSRVRGTLRLMGFSMTSQGQRQPGLSLVTEVAETAKHTQGSSQRMLQAPLSPF